MNYSFIFIVERLKLTQETLQRTEKNYAANVNTFFEIPNKMLLKTATFCFSLIVFHAFRAGFPRAFPHPRVACRYAGATSGN
jgi:hypothetical protein